MSTLALFFNDDPSVTRLSRTLTVLHWIAALLGVVLIVVAILAVAIVRRNQRAALSERDDDPH